MRLEPLDQYGSPAYAHAACADEYVFMVPGRDGVLACEGCGCREDSPATGRLSDGFDLIHRQWGLRGDPFAWEALRDHLADQPTPGELRDYLLDAFAAVIGVDLRADTREAVYVEAYAHGGMSSGHVHLSWWREKGLPLIAARAGRT